MRILIVEDDQAIARHVQAQISKSGYDAEVVHDGEEALLLGEANDYSAVILRLGLPLLDGLSVLQRWDRPFLARSRKSALAGFRRKLGA